MKSPLLATLAGRFGAKSAPSAGVTGRFYLLCPDSASTAASIPEIYHKLAELTKVQYVIYLDFPTPLFHNQTAKSAKNLPAASAKTAPGREGFVVMRRKMCYNGSAAAKR